MRSLITLAFALMLATSFACAKSADRAKTGLGQAGNELGTATGDAEKNVGYGAKDAKDEVKGKKGKKKEKED